MSGYLIPRTSCAYSVRPARLHIHGNKKTSSIFDIGSRLYIFLENIISRPFLDWTLVLLKANRFEGLFDIS